MRDYMEYADRPETVGEMIDFLVRFDRATRIEFGAESRQVWFDAVYTYTDSDGRTALSFDSP